MSYNNYQGNQQGYQPYPPNQQSQHGPGYNAPQQGYGQPGYSNQAASQPFQGQAFQAPMSNQAFGQPMVQGYPQPAQQQYQQPPMMPPQQQQYQQSMANTSQQQQYIPPAAPFDPNYNADADVAIIRKATKGFGTDEKALISVLAQKSPAHALQLSQRFEQLVGKSLISTIEKETRSWFSFGLVGCASGPLDWDVALLHRAMKGLGTHEDLLTEILLGRQNGELQELKHAYQHKHHKDLQAAVQGELSMKTERMFNMALTARRDEEFAFVDPTRVQADIQQLYNAGVGRVGTDEITICGIIMSRSDNHLRAVAQGYQQMHRKTLPEAIRSEFSDHMKEGLLHALEGAIDRPARDAHLLEASMAGLGTKDERLAYRIVRMKWDRHHTNLVKQAYQRSYGKDLIQRIKGETSGDFERLLVACIQ